MLKVKLKPNKLRNILLAVIPGLIVAGFWGFANQTPRAEFTAPVESGLVGYWKFDEGTGLIAYDSSGLGNHGQLSTFTCGNDPLEYEGETYATVLINDQCWMAENLNIGTRIDGLNEQNNDSVIQKYCYLDSDANCATDGGLYQWAQALDLPYTCNSTSTCTINTPHQGICPDGWHIPSDQDWYDLTNYLSTTTEYWCGGNSTQIAKSLATTDDVEPNWTNSDTACRVGNDRSTNNLTGFSVLPAGIRYTDGSFGVRTDYSYLWSASQYTATDAWYRTLCYFYATVDRSSINKAVGFSVRCLRDSNGEAGGSPTWTAGKIGSALQFDGKDNYVEVGDVYDGVKSVEFWLKTSSSTQQILDLSGSAYVALSGSAITATGWADPTIYVNGKEAAAITANTWHHIVISTDTGINASTTVFGKGPDSYFDGILDELRFYNRALSASEVIQNYRGSGRMIIHADAIEEPGLVTSGLILHLDADAIEGLSDNDSIAQWDDLSGEDNHATQATGANRPTYKTNILNGKPVVRFGGSHNLFVSNPAEFNISNLTIILVTVPHSFAPVESPIISRLRFVAEQRYWRIEFRSSDLEFYTHEGGGAYNADWNLISPYDFNIGNPELITARFDGTDKTLHINGNFDCDQSWERNLWATGDVPIEIASHNNGAAYYNGDIAEILIYDRALTTQEREKVEQYLGKKWLEWKKDNGKKTIIAANPLWQCNDPLEYEGETYATVLINDQCWMAENLNIGTRIDGANEQNNDSVIQKYCYLDSDANCATDGGLYQWAQALDLPYTCNSTSTCTINDPHQGICPDGWHIPSDQDWYDLTDYLSANSQYWCGGNSTQIAKSLATTDDVEPNWTNSATACHVGNDRSTNNLTGFSVLPAGGRRAGGSFYDRSSLSGLWSASQGTATSAWRRRLTYGNATVYRGSGDKAYGFSVRCLRE